MKCFNYSFILYFGSFAIILVNIAIFPDIFGKGFNLIDSLDNGHSSYLEKVLSAKKEEALILPRINSKVSEEIIFLNQVSLSNIHTYLDYTTEKIENVTASSPIYFHNKRLQVRCFDTCGYKCNRINYTEDQLISCFHSCNCEVCKS